MLARALILTILIMMLILSIMSNVALRQANSSVKHAANTAKQKADTTSAQLQMAIDNLQDGLGVVDETNSALNLNLEQAMSRINTCETQLAEKTSQYNSCVDDQVKCQFTEKMYETAESNYKVCSNKLSELNRSVSLNGRMELEDSFKLGISQEKFSPGLVETFTESTQNTSTTLKAITEHANEMAQKMVHIRATANAVSCKSATSSTSTEASDSAITLRLPCLEYIVSETLKVPLSTVRIAGVSGIPQLQFGCVGYILGYFDRPEYVTDAELISTWENMSRIIEQISQESFSKFSYTLVVSKVELGLVKETMNNVALATKNLLASPAHDLVKNFGYDPIREMTIETGPPQPAKSETIECSGLNSCQDKVISRKGAPVNLVCRDDSSCQNATMNLPSGSSVDCVGTSSCQNANAFCSDEPGESCFIKFSTTDTSGVPTLHEKSPTHSRLPHGHSTHSRLPHGHSTHSRLPHGHSTQTHEASVPTGTGTIETFTRIGPESLAPYSY